MWTKGESEVRPPQPPLLTPPLGPTSGRKADPHAVLVRVSPGATTSRFSIKPDERVHLPPPIWSIRHPQPTDDPATTPRHPPALGHWVLTTSSTTTHPGTLQSQLTAPRGQLCRLLIGRQRRRPPDSCADHRISRLGTPSSTQRAFGRNGP